MEQFSGDWIVSHAKALREISHHEIHEKHENRIDGEMFSETSGEKFIS